MAQAPKLVTTTLLATKTVPRPTSGPATVTIEFNKPLGFASTPKVLIQEVYNGTETDLFAVRVKSVTVGVSVITVTVLVGLVGSPTAGWNYDLQLTALVLYSDISFMLREVMEENGEE